MKVNLRITQGEVQFLFKTLFDLHRQLQACYVCAQGKGTFHEAVIEICIVAMEYGPVHTNGQMTWATRFIATT